MGTIRKNVNGDLRHTLLIIIFADGYVYTQQEFSDDIILLENDLIEDIESLHKEIVESIYAKDEEIIDDPTRCSKYQIVRDAIIWSTENGRLENRFKLEKSIFGIPLLGLGVYGVIIDWNNPTDIKPKTREIFSKEKLKFLEFGPISLNLIKKSKSNTQNSIASDSVKNERIYIPDKKFRTALINNGVTINNGFVDHNEVKHVEKLDLSGYDIENISGLEEFVYLRELNCSNNNFRILDLSNQRFLYRLLCDNCGLVTIMLPKTPCLFGKKKHSCLTVLNCSNNKLKFIDLENCEGIEHLNCSNNSLLSLDLQNFQELSSLDCRSNNIKVISIEGCNNLKTLQCSQNEISDLDLSSKTNLTHFNSGMNLFRTIDFSGCKSLKVASISSPVLKNIKFGNLLCLKSLTLINCTVMSSIDLKGLPFLENLTIHNCDISKIDISQNKRLDWITLTNNKLTSLDISANKELKVVELSGNPGEWWKSIEREA